MLNWVEHEKSFKTSGQDLTYTFEAEDFIAKQNHIMNATFSFNF